MANKPKRNIQHYVVYYGILFIRDEAKGLFMCASYLFDGFYCIRLDQDDMVHNLDQDPLH